MPADYFSIISRGCFSILISADFFHYAELMPITLSSFRRFSASIFFFEGIDAPPPLADDFLR